MTRAIVQLSLRSLRRNSRRTVVSIAAIAFGVAALIVSAGFVESLLLKLREDTIRSQLGHVQIQHRDFVERGFSAPFAHLLTRESIKANELSALPGVRVVTPRLGFGGLVSMGETTLTFFAQGVDPRLESQAFGPLIVQGEPLRPNDNDGVMLGEGLAANLGAKPGDKVVLLVTTARGGVNARDAIVRGTYATVSKFSDDTAIRLPILAAEDLLRVTGAQQWLVFLDSTDNTSATAARIRAALAGSGVQVTQWDDESDFYRKTEQLFARQFGFLRTVIIVIILLSVMNAMTMNVMERTFEVGVMLAMGDSRRDVLSLFALEGALLGMVGAFFGTVVGVAAGMALDAVGIPLPAPPGMNHGFDAGVSLSVTLTLAAAVIGASAAALAALPPAIRASRLSAVTALRYGR